MLFFKRIAESKEYIQPIDQLLRILALQARAEIAPAPFNSHLRMLQKVARATQLAGDALLYPCGGYDAWTAFQLHPQAKSVVLIGREAFGSNIEMQRCLESMYMTAQEPAKNDMSLLASYACQYDYDSEKRFTREHLNGGYALFKLATYMHWYPLTIEKRRPLGLDVTRVVLVDVLGQEREVWHVHTDLGFESEALNKFLDPFTFGGLLLKAALDITNPREHGLGFYKNILQLVKYRDLPIIMDRPLNQERYMFFEQTYIPQRVTLGCLNTFGYLKGAQESVEIAQGRYILPYDRFVRHARKMLPRFANNEFNLEETVN